MLLIVLERLQQRTIEPEDDEFVGIGLSGHAPVAERIVVVIEQADASPAEWNHALDGLERKPEYGTEAAKVVRIGNMKESGNLVLDEEAVSIHVIEVNNVDLLEGRRRPLIVVTLDDQKRCVVDRRQIADGLPHRFESVEPLFPRVCPLPDVELVDDEAPLIG